MAKHKSATEVTVVTEERSAIQRWVEQHWGKALVLAILVAVGILYSQASDKQAKKAKAAVWGPLVEAEGDLDAVMQAAQSIDSPIVAGWGWAEAAVIASGQSEYEDAQTALENLTKIDGHILNSTVFAMPGAEDKSLAQGALERIQATKEWEASHSSVLNNPDPAEGSPVVVIKTPQGDIEITLYQEKAPEHVANFLKLIDEKFYDGILFHRTVDSPGMQIIQSGDPNTREDDVSQWGSGGPGYTQKAEKNGLIHTPGVLSAAMPSNSQESSGSQFYITLNRCHHLDDRHTVFGKVTAGMDVARAILEAPTRELSEENTREDIPVNPVPITTIERQ